MKSLNIITVLIVALGIIIGAYILGDAYKYKFKTKETIEVTGAGKKDFQADLIIWNANFQIKDFDLAAASQKLSADKQRIQSYLTNQGIKADEIVFSAVSIDKDFEYRYDSNGNSQRVFSGYSLNQSVEVKSKDLDRIENVSREISDLISQGIELNSSMPNYYYSGLEDLKLELIAEATENARKRAENIAEKSNAGLGDLIQARMGVFQITGQYSDEDFTYGGVYNTTSKDKTANITVKLKFKIN
ncbi:MAG: SIMPL domain-containing protein [Weeksellaceae bacterium]